jgi:hypothetical protein
VLLEKRQRGIGPSLLICPERNIEDQQGGDERGFDAFSDNWRTTVASSIHTTGAQKRRAILLTTCF